MRKRKPAPHNVFDPFTHSRLLAVGTYESALEAGTCEIQFDAPLEPVDGLPQFSVLRFVSAPGRASPVPAEGRIGSGGS